MKNISDLATGFYEIVNGEGELGDVLSDVLGREVSK